jgi:hypothetical protein
MQLLRDSYRPENLEPLMCRTLVSVDWQGYLYDCDFNQMLDLPLPLPELIGRDRPHLRDLLGAAAWTASPSSPVITAMLAPPDRVPAAAAHSLNRT